MAYRKKYNIHDRWLQYCEKNKALINEMNLNSWVFEKEKNFRDFVTYGIIDKNKTAIFDFCSMEDALFWKLNNFIQSYFDMDGGLFEKFEKQRVKR